MKIVIPCEEGKIKNIFEETTRIGFFDVAGGEVINAMEFDLGGSGAEAVVNELIMYHTDVVICGGITGRSKKALINAGIIVYSGIVGGMDQAVSAFLNGSLVAGGCQEHSGEEGCSGSCSGCAGCSGC